MDFPCFPRRLLIDVPRGGPRPYVAVHRTDAGRARARGEARRADDRGRGGPPKPSPAIATDPSAPSSKRRERQTGTGDDVNNHERQSYTAGNRNTTLDGQGACGDHRPPREPAVKNAHGDSDDQAHRHTGTWSRGPYGGFGDRPPAHAATSMNGITDNNETVTVADFRTILGYAQRRHLARRTFWSVNRARPRTGGRVGTCSGVSQQPWDFTRVFAQYNG